MKSKSKLKSLWKILCGNDDTENKQCTPACFPGEDARYLIDFRAGQFGQPQGYPVPDVGYGSTVAATPIDDNSPNPGYTQKIVVPVPVRPKDVLHELGRHPTNWSLNGLDAKIEILTDKLALISQHYASQEVAGLLECLENRKEIDKVIMKASAEKSGPLALQKGRTYREFFSRFDATDEKHIDALCKKHDLVMKPADIFIPEMPDEAVQLMKEYNAVVDALCGKKPRMFVIANKEQFRDADGKRDPILLVQSPFGFYYYILGAWAEEMLLLSEL